MLPATAEFRERLAKQLEKHGTKKPLAEAIGAKPATITRLTKPAGEAHKFSEYVKPICDHFGWPYPYLARTDEDRAWHVLREQLPPEVARSFLEAMKATVAATESRDNSEEE
jgi:hypothetical protein